MDNINMKETIATTKVHDEECEMGSVPKKLFKENLKKVFHINKKLLPLKIMIFFWNAGVAGLFPYFTAHMQYLGITIQQTGIIFALLPVVSFIGSPFLGCLADKIGDFKKLILIYIILGSLGCYSLLWIPRDITNTICPEVSTLNKSCINEAIVHQVDILDEQLNNSTMDSITLSDCEINCENAKYLASFQFCSFGNGTKICKNMNQFTTFTLSSFQINASLSSLYQNIDNEITCSASSQHCIVLCNINITSCQQCKCKVKQLPSGHNLTFFVYLIVRVLSGLFIGSVYSIQNAAIFTMIKDEDSSYGQQKVWDMVACSITPFIAGALMDYVTKQKGYPDYSPPFYMFLVFSFCTFIAVAMLDLEIQMPTKTVFKNVRKILTNIEVIVFLLIVLFGGFCWGFMETFLFLYLLELGSSKTFLGITALVSYVPTIPTIYFSKKLITKFGTFNIMSFSFLVYGIRFVGYSYIPYPELALIFEALEAFSVHLLWVAAISHAATFATPGTLATIQSLMGGFHYSAGRGMGSLIGGFLLGAYGIQKSYRYFGIGSFIVGLCLLFLYYMILKRFYYKPVPVEETNEETFENNKKENEDIDIGLDDIQESNLTDCQTENNCNTKDLNNYVPKNENNKKPSDV